MLHGEHSGSGPEGILAVTTTFNIYCDESCHLEHDGLKVMTLGAVWCSTDKARDINTRIREIKANFGYSRPGFEAKWNKVSNGLVELYLGLVDYFFDDDDLHYRGLVVADKTLLDHTLFQQDHATWYFKMYFELLKTILDPQNRYRVYLDIKDTRSSLKVASLHEVLANNLYDFKREIVEWVQTIQSHEVEIMQITDLLTGALSYINRELHTNAAKVRLAKRIIERSKYSLTKSTLYREQKMNIFVWEAQDAGKW